MAQYPYTLEIQPKQEIVKDANGNFIAPTITWTPVCKCREEASRGYKVDRPDGVGYIATVTIFAPKGTEAIAPGMTVRVMDGDIERASGKVVYSRKEYFHTRIWL